MMDTVLNLGPQRRVGRRPRGAHRGRALRLGLLPPASCRCSATSCAGSRASASRRRSPRVKKERGVDARHRARRRRAARADRLQELYRTRPFYDFPTDPREQLTRSDPSRVRLVDGRAGRPVPPHQPASRTTGGRRSTCSRWSTATRARRRAPGWPSAATRSPVRPTPSGDFLPHAQGEDVVSGVRTPRDLSELRDWMPEAARSAHGDPAQARGATTRTCRTPSSRSRRGVCSCCRRGAPSAPRRRPCVRGRRLRGAAADARPRPSRRSTPERSTRSCTRSFDTDARATRCSRAGSRASPGAAKGAIVFTAPEAVEQAADGRRDVILVRPFTEADDVAGFHAAAGILTSEGGKASHAALVARGMGRPAVTGAAASGRRSQGRRGADRRCRPARGRLHRDRRHQRRDHDRRRPAGRGPYRRPVRDGPALGRRAAPGRHTGERGHARGRRAARTEFGAEGIGLCRTEHMFMAADRQPKMRAMIMAGDEAGRRAALDELLPLQQSDFEGLFEAMAGLAGDDSPARPAPARVPARPLRAARGDRARADRPQPATSASSRASSIGCGRSRRPTRCSARAACGWAMMEPEVYEMQVRAIAAGRACGARATGRAPHLEIMIPLVAYERELELVRDLRRVGGRGGGSQLRDRLQRRHDDRAPARVLHRRPDRAPRRLLLVRHQRPHADARSASPATTSRAGSSPATSTRRSSTARPFETIDQPGVGRAGADRRVRRAASARPDLEARRLRRARRRPRVDPLLPRRRARLRELLPVPAADRPRSGRPGGDRRLRARPGG